MPGEYVGLESEPKIRHVHCLGPTMIDVFDTGLEAIRAYNAYEDIVIIYHTASDGKKSQSEVPKSEIQVMSEEMFELL